MKLASFTHHGITLVGGVEGDEIVDLAAAAPDLPREMVALLELGPEALTAAHAALARGPRVPLAAARLEAAIGRPP